MNAVILDKSNQTVDVKSSKLYTTNHTIPLKLIDLLIINEKIDITTKNILVLTHNNIPLIFISNGSQKMSLVLPLISKNSELKMMQYHAQQKSLGIAQHILYHKFTSHKSSLLEFDIDIDISNELKSLENATDIPTLIGIEGAFAKLYFGHYFSLFERKLTKGFRSKNPPLDPVNAMLSFVYMLTYHSITAKLYMRGFDPSISYLHTPFRGHFALSSDMMEFLRADINDFVAKLFLDQVLTTDDFTNKNGVYLKYTSRKKLWEHINPFTHTLNRKINKQIATIKKMIDPSEISFSKHPLLTSS